MKRIPWSAVVVRIAVLCLPLSGAAGQGSEAPRPVCHCRRVERDLQLSGRVDDPLWQNAQIVALNEPVEGKPGRYRTQARLLYNDRYLYLAFECQDDYVWGTLKDRDAEIYNQECVEAFVCPSGKMRQYYEINVSPLNTVFDALILNGRPIGGDRTHLRSWKEYSCEGLVTRVHIRGELGVPGAQGWSAEYAIPFSAIVGSDNLVPQPGETWLINLFRIDAPEPGRPEYYAWSPTGAADFHLPWRFGTLVFER